MTSANVLVIVMYSLSGESEKGVIFLYIQYPLGLYCLQPWYCTFGVQLPD